MPILERETDLFPDHLFDLAESPIETESQWWAVYTKSRQEKELTRALLALELPFYCPTIPHKYRSPAGRMRTSYVPLFSNYLFMYTDGEGRYRAFKSNLICNTIDVTDGARLTHDLRQIQRLIELNIPLNIEAQLQPGKRVRIKSGPMTGIEGIILKREGRSHLQVAVNFLQQGASVKLEDFEVERID
ncbi:MAG: UpxY family transcription antiterminator [Planctomycetes bacterium]|nr:UpxY family transcription antiterminator [Planctomycetota bacterium]